MSDEGQHTGRLSDAIDNGDGGAAGRLRRTMKPTGKTYRPDGHSTGNGDQCTDAAGELTGHGKMYVLPSGRQWCPMKVHEKVRTGRSPSDG